MSRRERAEQWAKDVDRRDLSLLAPERVAVVELRAMWNRVAELEAENRQLQAVADAARLCLAEDVRGGFALKCALAALDGKKPC